MILTFVIVGGVIGWFFIHEFILFLHLTLLILEHHGGRRGDDLCGRVSFQHRISSIGVGELVMVVIDKEGGRGGGGGW